MDKNQNRFLLILVFALTCVVVMTAWTRADSSTHYYEGSGLAVRIGVDDTGRYTGVIRMANQEFPFEGHIEEGKLIGTFRSSGHDFPFTATLVHGELTLVTGGTTYVLKNANPLANAHPDAASHGDAPAAHNIVGKWAISGDLGGEQFTLTLSANGEMLVETSSGNSSSGPTYKYADNTITFDGSTGINKLSLAGTWKIDWKSADEFTTTDDMGKPLTLHRIPAGK